MTTIGWMGLGSMGAPLAGRLLLGSLKQGLSWRDTPREVTAAADVVISMVTDDAALAAITGGPDGILAGLRPGTRYIDMSTVSPRASRELAERSGIDPELAARAMTASPIGSPMPHAREPLVLDLPEQAWFDMHLMRKDIRLALDAARQSGVPHRDLAGMFQVLTKSAS